jgi:hypothetical protein
MFQTVNVIGSAEKCEILFCIIGDRNQPLTHVQRARSFLLSAERLPVLEVSVQEVAGGPPMSYSMRPT